MDKLQMWIKNKSDFFNNSKKENEKLLKKENYENHMSRLLSNSELKLFNEIKFYMLQEFGYPYSFNEFINATNGTEYDNKSEVNSKKFFDFMIAVYWGIFELYKLKLFNNPPFGFWKIKRLQDNFKNSTFNKILNHIINESTKLKKDIENEL